MPASAVALARISKSLCAVAGILAADESTGTIGKRVSSTTAWLEPSGEFACAAELHASALARTQRNGCRTTTGCLAPHCGNMQRRHHSCVDTLSAPTALPNVHWCLIVDRDEFGPGSKVVAGLHMRWSLMISHGQPLVNNCTACRQPTFLCYNFAFPIKIGFLPAHPLQRLMHMLQQCNML